MPTTSSPSSPADAAWGAVVAEMRTFQDLLAGAAPDVSEMAALAADLRDWSTRLGAAQVDEDEQLFGRRPDLPGRGQALVPCVLVDEASPSSLVGRVTLGRYYLGGHGAAHGGAAPLVFNDVLGRLANAGGRPRARTAYLHVDFRAIAPVGEELGVRAWIEREEGRKTFVRGDLRHGEVVCAEAELLCVSLLPGQP